MEYLFGTKAITPYRWIFCGFLFLGAVSELDVVWAFADITMAAMAFPNLVGTIALSGVVLAMTKDYFGREHVPYAELVAKGEAGGTTKVEPKAEEKPAPKKEEKKETPAPVKEEKKETPAKESSKESRF